jgi:hypothetical protein
MPLMVPSARVPELGAEIRNKAYKVGFEKSGIKERSYVIWL